MSRLCPAGHGAMHEETYRGVKLDVCAQCAGMWFDEGELGRVMRTDTIALLDLDEEHIPQVQAEPAANAGRQCPNGHGVLERYHYFYDSPIALDLCGTCHGVWVEDQELTKIQQWLDSVRHPADSEAMRQAQRETTIAEFVGEHERTMGRLLRLEGLFTLLHRRPLRW